MLGTSSERLDNPPNSRESYQPSTIISQVNDAVKLTALMTRLSHKVFEKLKISRQNFDKLKQISEKVTEHIDKAFCHIDSEIEKKLTMKEKKFEKDKQRRKISHKKEEKRKNQQYLIKNQISHQYQEEIIQEKIQKEQNEQEEANQSFDGDMKQWQLVSKSNSKKFEVYMCFLCFQINQSNYMWEDSQQYLTHLSEKHELSADFQFILRSVSNKFLFSHVLFKGKLFNIFSNQLYLDYLHIFYLIEKEQFQRIMICKCNFPSFHTLQSKNSSTIFDDQSMYVKHVAKRHKSKQDYLSHFVKQKGSKVYLHKNPQFDITICKEKNEKALVILRKLIKRHIEWFSINRCLIIVPRNILEIISCYPGLIQPQYTSSYYPQCHICSKIFNLSSEYCQHMSSNHPRIQKQKVYAFSQDQLRALGLIKQQDRCQFYIEDKNCQLTQNQRLILKSHIYLISTMKQREEKRVQICGHCKAYFFQKNDYLIHIYTQHDTLSPLNSHYIKFIQKVPKGIEEEFNQADQ